MGVVALIFFHQLVIAWGLSQNVVPNMINASSERFYNKVHKFWVITEELLIIWWLTPNKNN